VPPVPHGGTGHSCDGRYRFFPFIKPVIRRHRNAGDAHAAGAEQSGAPKSVKSNLMEVSFFRENRGSIFVQKSDRDHSGKIFNRDRDRDQQMKIANRFQNKNRDLILISKSRIDFRTKIGSRSYAPSVLLLLKPVFNRRSISK
jgi:hypothetical protein